MNTPPKPIYSAKSIESPAYHLRYSWTGWPSKGFFPTKPNEAFFKVLDSRWETDGVRRLESTWFDDRIQITCSVKPSVSPVFFTGRIKGRLQHAISEHGNYVPFSRKVSFRSLGENKREQVQAYIAKQVTKEQFLEERFLRLISQYTFANSAVRFDEPSETNRGRYWYDLHVVLVTESRMRFTDETSLSRISELCEKVAAKKGCRIGSRSVMPDHLHLALRGNIELTPEEIALSLMNNIAFAFGQQAVFRPSYYVGTFGEYDMGAVRE